MIRKYLLLALIGFCIASCEEANDVPNGYIEITQDGANTLVLKGYESASSGFSVFQPENFEAPFYIKDKQFYGDKYEFAVVNEKRLDEMPDSPENVEWQKNTAITVDACYWIKCSSLTCFRYAKMRVTSIEGNDVTIEYVLGNTEVR